MTAPILVIGGLILAVALVGYRGLLERRATAKVPVLGRVSAQHQGPHRTHRTPVEAPGDGRMPPCDTVSGLTKTEAEELLDWLEGNGHTGYEVSYDEAGFTVRRP